MTGEYRATGLTGATGQQVYWTLSNRSYRSHWSHRHDWIPGQQVSLEPQGQQSSLATLEQQGSLATLEQQVLGLT